LMVVITCASCGSASSRSASGSGGSGGGGSLTSATPPGSYAVVVTATSVDHAIQNINLTVQVQ
jgi:hypothetical protein